MTSQLKLTSCFLQRNKKRTDLKTNWQSKSLTSWLKKRQRRKRKTMERKQLLFAKKLCQLSSITMLQTAFSGASFKLALCSLSSSNSLSLELPSICGATEARACYWSRFCRSLVLCILSYLLRHQETVAHWARWSDFVTYTPQCLDSWWS